MKELRLFLGRQSTREIFKLSLTWKIQMHLQDIQSLGEIIILLRLQNCFKVEGTTYILVFSFDFIQIYCPKALGINEICHEKRHVEEEEDSHQNEHIFPALNLGSVDSEMACIAAHQISFRFYFCGQRRGLLHIRDSFFFLRLVLSPGGILSTFFPGALQLVVITHVINTGR